MGVDKESILGTEWADSDRGGAGAPGPIPGRYPPGGKYSNRNNGLRLLNALRRGGGAQGDKSVAIPLGQPAIGEPIGEKPGSNRIAN